MFIFFIAICCISIKSLKIAFGSCFNYEDPESMIFYEIAKHNPDIFIWLGDAAYVTQKNSSNKRNSEVNQTIIDFKFNLTKYNPGYQKLMNVTQIHGVWDDHDYNERDGIITNPTKEMVRQSFLNFLGVPSQDERRMRSDGIYYSIKYQKIKIILLDVRWNRNPENEDVLGNSQWQWLDQELNDIEVEQFIVGSGSQILPDDRLFIDVWYKKSRDRLLDMLNGKQVLLITGDVHFAEVLQDPCTNIIEVTSSGLSFGSHYRGPLRGLFEFFAELFQPDSYSQYYERFADKNYAIINTDEETIQIYNETQLMFEVGFNKTSPVKCEDLKNSYTLTKYFWNFVPKMKAFTKMLLFRQLLKLVAFGLFFLMIIIAFLFIGLRIMGLEITKKSNTKKQKIKTE